MGCGQKNSRSSDGFFLTYMLLIHHILTFQTSGDTWPMAFYIVHTFGVYSILFYPITLGGRRGTTVEFATIPFHLDLFSAALVELAKSIPVHSLILSSNLFFCLPLFFPFHCAL